MLRGAFEDSHPQNKVDASDAFILTVFPFKSVDEAPDEYEVEDYETGFGLGTGTVAEGWLQDAVHFWQQQSGTTAIQSPPRHSERGLGGEAYSLNGTRHNSLQPGVNIVDGRKVVILKYSAKRQ